MSLLVLVGAITIIASSKASNLQPLPSRPFVLLPGSRSNALCALRGGASATKTLSLSPTTFPRPLPTKLRRQLRCSWNCSRERVKSDVFAVKNVKFFGSNSAKKASNHVSQQYEQDQMQLQEQFQNQKQQQQQQEPTLEELRSQLGPIALFVSNTIELTVVTLGSYLSGGLLGYFGGGILNIGVLFGQGSVVDPANVGLFGKLSARLSQLNSKAFGNAKQWGKLSAAFSGFHNLVRMVRGGEVEDVWNAFWGSALTGAFLNKSGGAQAMLQGAATYACFTYFIDKFFGSPEKELKQRQALLSPELVYNDVSLGDGEL
mmetsp:Transcript_16447/g.33095  ORF Transcript_16447/g.33095 Transcript_16447/m.33095 type:complete len:317 (+) Transcript_16447:136-1086(+)